VYNRYTLKICKICEKKNQIYLFILFFCVCFDGIVFVSMSLLVRCILDLKLSSTRYEVKVTFANYKSL
jgi:hypothetical protein